MKTAWAVILTLFATGAALAAPRPVVAPRALGLVVSATPTTPPLTTARLADAILEVLSGTRKWETTVLTPECALVRASGAAWPLAPGEAASGYAGALRRFVDVLRLEDLLVLRLDSAATSQLEVLWVRAGAPEARSFWLKERGGEAAVTLLARQLATRLDAGFEKAPLLEPPPVQPVTPPVSAPAVPGTTAPVAVKPGETALSPAPSAGTSGPTTAPGPLSPPSAPAGHSSPDATAAGGTAGRTTPTPGDLPSVSPATPAPPAVSAPETPGTPAPVAVQPGGTLPAPAPTPAPGAPAPTAGPAATGPAATGPEGTVGRATPAPAELPSVTPAPAEGTLSNHFAAAEEFMREGDFTRAEDSAQRAVDAGDPKGAVCLLQARIAAARGNFAAERSWLERALAADGTLTEARLRLAENLRKAGLWRKAVDEYQGVLKDDPKSRHAYLGLAAVYGQQNQPKRAAEFVAEALKHYPEDVGLYLRLGDLHNQRKDLAEAEAAFDRAARLAQAPADKAAALDRLGDLYIGAQRYHEGFVCHAEASKLRGEVSSPLAERRYLQVMAAADEGLQGVLTQAGQRFTAYLAQDNVTREETYEALTALRGQAQEVAGFMEAVTPPAGMKLDHARRKLAYSLVLEAAISAMTYLDTGRQELLENYRTRLNEAQALLGAIKTGKG